MLVLHPCFTLAPRHIAGVCPNVVLRAESIRRRRDVGHILFVGDLDVRPGPPTFHHHTLSKTRHLRVEVAQLLFVLVPLEVLQRRLRVDEDRTRGRPLGNLLSRNLFGHLRVTHHRARLPHFLDKLVELLLFVRRSFRPNCVKCHSGAACASRYAGTSLRTQGKVVQHVQEDAQGARVFRPVLGPEDSALDRVFAPCRVPGRHPNDAAECLPSFSGALQQGAFGHPAGH